MSFRSVVVRSSTRRVTKTARLGTTAGLVITLLSCAAVPTTVGVGAETSAPETAADLYIVDCLLPGQVRQVGGRPYMTPRRPTRTTASDCRIRGGEYVAYDRANLKTALNVWMAEAERGDADAQNNVGDIFEQGLGDESNYEAAAIWYQKAADQGHSAALFNLGTLYEQGLGVPMDRLKALNLYRQSWGLKDDDLVYESALNNELRTVRAELQKEIDAKNSQVRLLSNQVQQLESREQLPPAEQQELTDLRAWVAQLSSEQTESEQKLARTREPSFEATPITSFSNEGGLRYDNKDFGRYYALIIGNQDYDRMEDLASPNSDAARVADILQRKYGFTVQLVQNANDLTVLKAVNNLANLIGENDNLLIYYAGHGSRRGSGSYEAGYWLPVNADPPPDDTFWVPTAQITDHIATIKAQRVLVVADSCYAGILENEPGAGMFGNDAASLKSAPIIERRFARRSRLLVSSGGDRPVLDTSGTGNSVFANALIHELEQNNAITTTTSLFLSVREQVRDSAAKQGFDQIPELKVIKRAGHEMGDFFFVPSAG